VGTDVITVVPVKPGTEDGTELVAIMAVTLVIRRAVIRGDGW
jgi:hypothetical protein